MIILGEYLTKFYFLNIEMVASMRIIIIILSFIFFNSCNNKKETRYIVNPELQPGKYTSGSILDSIDLRQIEKEAICLCKQIGDTTFISLWTEGGCYSEGVNISIFHDLFDIRYYNSYDLERVYVMDNQSLEINKDSVLISDKITGIYQYQGMEISKDYPNQLINITGHFNCSIKDSLYTIENFDEDLKREELVKKMASHPDSIKDMFLFDLDLEKVPSEIEKFKGLRRLEITNNKLTAPDFFLLSEMKGLNLLNLTDNQIFQIHESIGLLKSLEHLDLSGNEIQSLPKSLFQLEELVYLDLGYNKLKNIPDDIKQLKKLETLILYGRQNPKEISNKIFTLKSLKKLWLPDSLNYLSPDINRLDNLEFLALPWELIEPNKELIGSLKKLKELYPYNVYKSTDGRRKIERMHKNRLRDLKLMFPNLEIDTSSTTY